MALLVVRIEQCSPRSRKYRVVFDGADEMCLYKREIDRFGWTEGMEIPDDEYRRVEEELLIPRARQRAFYLLERQDRTGPELASKLVNSGYSKDIAAKVTKWFASLRYIDDERYAREYIDCKKNSLSRRRISEELMRKGIEREMAARLLEDLYDADEGSLIENILKKRHYDPETADNSQKAKMIRYLLARGFDYSGIRESI